MGNGLGCIPRTQPSGGVGSRSKSSSRSQRKTITEEDLLHRQALAMAIQQHQLSQRFDGSMSRRIGSTSSRKQTPSSSFRKPVHIVVDKLETKKIILVHGEGFGAWCWYKIIPLLEEAGLHPVALDLTGSGINHANVNSIMTLADYTKPLLDYLHNLHEDEKVILLGHSCGGASVSFALERFPKKITKAIFLGATMVLDGQRPFDVFAEELASAEVFMQESQLLMYDNGKDKPPTGLMLDKEQLKGLYFNQSPSKLWVIIPSESQKKFPLSSFQKCLSYHSSTVNALRFSPSGEFLASGADGGELVIWKLHSTDDGSTWKVLKTLLFHRKDVLDLQWSPDGGHLISGSVDNSCIIWDVNKGSVHQILDAHLHYVQGVSWDPIGCYVASLSSDRTCRIYGNKPQTKQKGYEKINFVSQYVLTKLEVQNMDDSTPLLAKTHLFHDETLNSFFRRLSWSPDGSFLLVPAGLCKFSPASDPINTAYIISRKDLSRPAVSLPGASKPIVAVRFCPILYKLQGSNRASLFKLPYRVIFAVATFNSLYIYDSESASPIVIVAGLHYAAITDISWSPNAKYLALSSQDGYCSILEFDDDELGVPFSPEDSKGASEGISSAINTKADVKDSMDVDHLGVDDTVRKADVEADEEKQVQPALFKTPDTNKSIKRRITPVAIS